MKLSELLNNFCSVSAEHDITVTSLAINSQHVKPGDLFFAFPGVKTDGRKFIDDAIKNGAVAVLAEGDQQVAPTKIPIFYLKDLAFKCGKIAAQFYANPSKKLSVIGVTGTNGKTSCTHFLAAAFTQLGIKSAVMGTVGNGIFGEPLNTQHQTTLDPISIQQFLANMVEQKVKIVAMEVSSHALCQGRVSGIDFAAAVFTNLTQDHLDYHHDMDAYWAAKRSLFENFNLPHAIINANDAHGQELLVELPFKQEGKHDICSYGIAPIQEQPQVSADQIILSRHGITANIHTPWGAGVLKTTQIGRYNLSNLLAVIATMLSLRDTFNISFDAILQSVENLPLVPGRLQTFNAANQPLVVVDYAHTPDALENVLGALRENCRGKLWCVFGCGGDRDAGKRPMMGGIAERLADHIIITDDNPRTENATVIVAHIVNGLKNKDHAMIEHDRATAIAYAISHAQVDDIVLVAGKGHEDYQEVGKEKHYYSDIDTVNKLLGLRV